MAKTILIVDPDMLFVEPVRQKLINAGHKVLTARSMREAESILNSTRPDVMITEILLEHMDSGFCLAWLAKNKYPDLPVIIVSAVTWHTGLYFGLSTAEDRTWIKADVMLNKPIRPEELESAIVSAFRIPKAA